MVTDVRSKIDVVTLRVICERLSIDQFGE